MPRSARTAIISLLGELVDALAVHPDDAGVRLQQPGDDLQRGRLPGAAGAENDLRVPRDQREADVLQHDFVVERQLTRGRTRRPARPVSLEAAPARLQRVRPRPVNHVAMSSINQRDQRLCVTKKSTAITATDPRPRRVVAWPTPWVPPVVRSPTWQATSRSRSRARTA